MIRQLLFGLLLLGCSGGEFRGVVLGAVEGGAAGAGGLGPDAAGAAAAGWAATTAGSQSGAEAGRVEGGAGDRDGGAAGAGLVQAAGGDTGSGGTGGGAAGIGQGGEMSDTGGQGPTGGVMATGGQTATGGGAGAGGSEPDPRDGMMLEVTYLGLNPDRDWDPDESISRPDPYICIEYETFVGCSPTCMDCMQTPMAWPYNDRGELILVHEGGRLEITVWEEDGEGQEDEYCASTTLQLTTIVQLPHEMRIMFGDVVRMDLRLSVPSEGLPVE